MMLDPGVLKDTMLAHELTLSPSDHLKVQTSQVLSVWEMYGR